MEKQKKQLESMLLDQVWYLKITTANSIFITSLGHELDDLNVIVNNRIFCFMLMMSCLIQLFSFTRKDFRLL